VRSLTCASSDCSAATAHRQCLLVDDPHPRMSDHPRQTASDLTGEMHDATFGVLRFPALSSIAALTLPPAAAFHRAGSREHVPRFEIGQRQRVACAPRARPTKGNPNVVGIPVIVGTPVWVVGQGAVLCGVESGADGLEGVGKGVSVRAGADPFGLRATDGGLKPPPPSSVEPSGIPTIPMDDPGPIDEARGGDAVADAAQAPGALAAIPPPSKGAAPGVPVTEPPMPADAPVTGLPMLGDVPVVELPMAANGGADETHVAPSIGEAPDVVGLTPGVASSVAPRGTPVCPTGAFGMPSGDVRPSGGRGEVFRGACA
jgi:hypothetical protein